MAAVYENVCKSPLLMRSTLDRSKNQDPSIGGKKKGKLQFYLDLETKCSGSSPASDFCSFMLQPLESPALD